MVAFGSAILTVFFCAVVYEGNKQKDLAFFAVASLILFAVLFEILQNAVFEFNSFVEMAMLLFWIGIWLCTLISCTHSIWIEQNIGTFTRAILFYLFFSFIPFVIFSVTMRKLSEHVRPWTNGSILELIPTWSIIPYLDALVIYSLVIFIICLPPFILYDEVRGDFKELFGSK